MIASVELRSRYHLLDAIGITQWYPKTNESALISNHPVFCATCLVLLPTDPAQYSLDAQKMLTGMLSVLALNTKNLGIAWIGTDINANNSYDLVIKALRQWAPQAVLIMGEKFSKDLLAKPLDFEDCRAQFQTFTDLDAIVQVTYHPNELQIMPENKRKAHRDLLNLKAQLSLVRKS